MPAKSPEEREAKAWSIYLTCTRDLDELSYEEREPQEWRRLRRRLREIEREREKVPA